MTTTEAYEAGRKAYADGISSLAQNAVASKAIFSVLRGLPMSEQILKYNSLADNYIKGWHYEWHNDKWSTQPPQP